MGRRPCGPHVVDLHEPGHPLVPLRPDADRNLGLQQGHRLDALTHWPLGALLTPFTLQGEHHVAARARSKGDVMWESQHSLLRPLKVCVTALSIALMPSIALAVNVSSDDGSGTQYWYQKLADGAKVTGNLKSTSGAKVYYSGRVVFDNNPDPSCGRYTTNTTSLTSVTKGGTCRVYVSPAVGMKYRVCRDINNLPDDCGSDSSEDAF